MRPCAALLALPLLLIPACSGTSRTNPTASQARAALLIAAADEAVNPAADQLAATDRALRECITTVSDNLSNAKTIGFKAAHPYFVTSSEAIIEFDQTQGPFENTRRPLDLAIQGPGYFMIKVPDSQGDGFAYTRNGAFFVNQHGQLVLGLGDGYSLQPPVTLPKGTTEGDVTISDSGHVFVKRPGTNTPTEVGQIKLSTFISPEYLNQLTGALYQTTQTSGFAVSSEPGENNSGTIHSGFLELSNADPIREAARLEQLKQWAELLRKARSK